MDAIIGTGDLSKRQYGITAQRSVSVPVSDGVNIDLDIFRPDGDGKFPVLMNITNFSIH